MMIKLLNARPAGNFLLHLEFSDGKAGILDGRELLKRTGALLEPLRTPDYFARAFVDAGGLCWPNGLELSPQRLYSMIFAHETESA
jgi:hypothetical protein